ncbi:MAG: aminotransferase class V-fold PLP-dependent enzyme [Geminicoccaceae bacterium]
MTARFYLDHAASSPLRPAARAALTGALDLAGNPSSVHAEGRAARAVIEAARRTLAAAIGGAAGGIVFTSGATEANAAALGSTGRVLASAVEHPSVLARPGVETVPVDGSGRLDLAALTAALAVGDVACVALMLANNETGVLQPVAETAALAHRAGARLHVDAVQALGRVPLDITALGADSMSLSAHKLGGPKGVGALWLRDPDGFEPLLRGGQEHRRRAGTENVAGIAGFAAAAAAIAPEEAARLEQLRRTLEAEARRRVGDAVVIADRAPRLPHITALALPGVAAATQVMALDLAGVAVSAGAACSSGKVATSHVLAAMGMAPALAASTIRVSLGWTTTASDIDRFRRLGQPRRAPAPGHTLEAIRAAWPCPAADRDDIRSVDK